MKNINRLRFNLTGNRYGMVTVVGLSDVQHAGGVYKWYCVCDCGGSCHERTDRLRRGMRTSCGCKKAERMRATIKYGKQHRGWTGHGNLSGSVWSRIVLTARHRKIDVILTITEAWALFEAQKGRCALSGVELYMAQNTSELLAQKHTASLDRIDSAKPYVLGNVQWVHKRLNGMKMSLSQDEFIAWCRRVAAHHT